VADRIIRSALHSSAVQASLVVAKSLDVIMGTLTT
jgi:hypothetical protein